MAAEYPHLAPSHEEMRTAIQTGRSVLSLRARRRMEWMIAIPLILMTKVIIRVGLS